MKAIVLFEPGPPENLCLVEVKDPDNPGPGELLVKVEACGIDRHDTLVRSGMTRSFHNHQLEVKEGGAWIKKNGLILGHEIAGTVLAVGPQVVNTRVGDRVTNNIKSTCRVCGTAAWGAATTVRAPAWWRVAMPRWSLCRKTPP